MQRRLKSVVLFCVCVVSMGWASSPQWEIDPSKEGWNESALVLKYFHYSELQRQWAWHLLGAQSFSGSETILDFGCGDGKITAEISHCIPNGTIDGVDSSSAMISFAGRCFPSKYFPNLTFRCIGEGDLSHESMQQRYDVVYSFCVFHLIGQPGPILKQLYECLKKDGKLLLVTPIGNNHAFFQASEETYKKYGWVAPWEGKKKPNPATSMRTIQGCQNCLIEAGFEEVSVVHRDTPTVFFNRQELVEWMVGTLCANWKIPFQEGEAFFGDLVDRAVELDPAIVDEQGGYHYKLSYLEVVAKKRSH